MPSISRWSQMFFIFMTILVSLVILQIGISPMTMTWVFVILALYALAGVFSLYGHIILPRLFKIYLGDAWIDRDVLVICNRDTTNVDDICSAAMAFKLLPLQPVTDMDDSEMKAMIQSVEGAVFSLPVGTLYCIHKTQDTIIPAEVKRLEHEMRRLQAQASMGRQSIFSALQSFKRMEIERERSRLMKSQAVAAVSFIMIQAKGRTAQEAITRVRVQGQQIENIAQQIGCTSKKITGIDLRNLVEAMLGDRALRWSEV
jgi:hypothetical protein